MTFGIGLNVAVTPDTGDDPWQTPAISLHQAAVGVTPTLGSTLLAILDQIRHCLDQLQAHGPDVIHRAYCEGSLLIGRDILYWSEAQEKALEQTISSSPCQGGGHRRGPGPAPGHRRGAVDLGSCPVSGELRSQFPELSPTFSMYFLQLSL